MDWEIISAFASYIPYLILCASLLAASESLTKAQMTDWVMRLN